MIIKLALLFFLCLSISSVAQQKEITLVSWNIRDFGKTKNGEELNAIAEILRDADVVALQEVVAGYGGAQAVAKLADILNRKGAKWDYLISDPTHSPKYVTERYAYLWKTAQIKIKNRGDLIKQLDEAVDREPFLIDFYFEKTPFTVINFHSRPFDQNPEREIKAISNYILNTLTGTVFLAGDFNMNEQEEVFNPLKKRGFIAALKNQKTTLKNQCSPLGYLNYAIDNIFYSKNIHCIKTGVIDFVGSCDNLEYARNLSDHLPVFVQFKLNKK
ncbi:endonuclease/exonuclease/phosphatase family protein [Leeuwenhoekiella sp. W20_SRS_FM14]|uniref:endonuclease/exonuclease/phosphatase family protein n=1 Tax=Leeuwenhoekiella sp. W20_SRS_FM14 TaxID=3240270 RepID=UPI003F96AEFB